MTKLNFFAKKTLKPLVGDRNQKPLDGDKLLPITVEQLRQWHRQPLKEQISGNLARIDQHIIPFEQVLKTPMHPSTASAYTVVFMHVPKTGGTTLEYLLAKNYKINGVIHINNPMVQKNPYALFKKGDLPHVVMGHYKSSSVVYRFIDRPLVHFIMLRDPIKRVLSYYDYLQTSPNHQLHAKASGRSLEQFIDADDMVELANAQTLRITGELHGGWQSKVDLDKSLAEAKQSLTQRFTLVGLTECYSEFLLMARKTIGWSDIYYERRNVSKKKTRPEDVSPDLLERIRERNACDIALYDYAKTLFKERCQALNITPKTLERFNEYNQQYQQLVGVDEI